MLSPLSTLTLRRPVGQTGPYRGRSPSDRRGPSLPTTPPNLTYRYPPQTDETIQTVISSKPEFASLSLDNGTARKVGKLFVHQLFASRMLRIYDNFIIFNEVGTGKTGVMYACANHCYKNYGLDPVIAYRRGACSTIRRVVFLAHNEANMRNMQAEYRRYSDPDSPSQPPDDFVYSTHGAWWTDNRGKKDDALKSEWDNTLFVIDEAHVLLTRSNIEGKAMPVEDEPEMYKWYRETLGKLSNIKLMLLTASILVERTLELGYYLRLIPGVEVPTDEEFYKRPTAAAELAKFVRGRVSYVRAVSAKAVRVYPEGSVPLADLMPGAKPGVGEPLDAPTRVNTGGIQLTMLPMSKMQTEEYMAIAKARKDKATNVALERRIALITYTGTVPVQRKGGRGHKAPPGIAPPPSLDFLASLKPRIPGRELVGTLDERSVKLAYILANIRKGGVAFIVTSYVEHGTNVIGAILAGNGYEQLNPKDDHLSSRKNGAAIRQGRDPMNALPKRERFTVIGDSARTSPNDIIRLTTYCNRDENVFGEYLRVVLISPAGATGLNIYHTIDYFEVDTAWNGEQEAQREGRVFRATSHDAQWRMKTMMRPGDRGPVEVRMHHLVAVPDFTVAPQDIRVGDLFDYQHIFTKDAPLRYWRRYLMAQSYDARIHQARNGITPAYPKPLKEDRSTYELIYAPEEIVSSLSKLASVLMRVGSIDADEYWDRYGSPEYSRHSYYLALSRVIRDRSELITPLGTHVYVRAIGNTLFGESVRYARTNRPIGREYYPDTTPYLAPLVYRTVSLADMVTAKDTTRASALPFEDVQSMFDFLADPMVELAPKSEAIERVLAVGMTLNPELFQAVRARYLGKSYFEYPRYGAILRTVEAYAALASTKAGASGGYQFPIPSEADVEEALRNPTVPIVRLHNLYAQFDENKQTHYGTYDQYMGALRLRIYDHRTRSFVAMPPDSPEYIVYSRLASTHVQLRYHALRERREGSLVKMIIYDPEGKVRLFNQMTEPRISKAGDMVKSTLPTGRILATVSSAQMMDAALYLGIYPEELPTPPPRKSFYRLDEQGNYLLDDDGNIISTGEVERLRRALESSQPFVDVLWRDRYDDPVEVWKMYQWANDNELSTMEYLKKVVYFDLQQKGLVFHL